MSNHYRLDTAISIGLFLVACAAVVLRYAI